MGLRPDEFWSLTPREIYLCFQAWAWRERLLADRAITTAWYTEAFARMKRVRNLRHYLRRARPKAQPEGAELEALQADLEAAAARMAPDGRIA